MNREAFRWLRHAMRHLALGHCAPDDAAATFFALATLAALLEDL